MKFTIEYHKEVIKDIRKLKFSNIQLIKLKKKVESISKNPLPKSHGGLGEPLRYDLKGLLKFRFDNNYRVVYKLVKDKGIMKIIIIGLRADSLVYKTVTYRK